MLHLLSFVSTFLSAALCGSQDARIQEITNFLSVENPELSRFTSLE